MAGNLKIEQLSALKKKVAIALQDSPAVATVLDELIDLLLPAAKLRRPVASSIQHVKTHQVNDGAGAIGQVE